MNKTFIAKARKVHGLKYDYSKVEYVNSQTKVCIIYNGVEYWQTPNGHLSGSCCENTSFKRLTTEQFIAKARKVHGLKYEYSKVKYINNRTKVDIVCPEHGEFSQTPDKHLSGANCRSCSLITRA